ncbi:MAG: chorismate synthase [Deltaproteobacteria bacterium]|nr:chorismate synthase [Deltaproteobacteria bacterium]
MSGSSFGVLFRVTTWGESHGEAIGVVVDGCPPSIPLSEEDVQKDLDRRRPGQKGTSPRGESDRVQILSGLYQGITTGTPIAMIVYNRDVDSRPYEELEGAFRPGHADYTYYKKYGIRDPRGGGRASARETVARVAAGAVAKKVLEGKGITVTAYTLEMGGVQAEVMDLEKAGHNWLCCPDQKALARMEERLAQVQGAGDSIGGVVGISARGCPPGLGEPVFDKLDADLAKAIMGIGAVKGIEIGAGFAAARMLGSQHNDGMTSEGFKSNHAGGVLGGISTGEEIWIRAAIKPIPSISLPQETVDEKGRKRTIVVKGRYDVCAIPRVLPVCEAMVRLVLVDHLLRQEAIRYVSEEGS